MKIQQKKSAAILRGPFVAIGNRGVTCPALEVLPEGVSLGFNPLPAKVRVASDMHGGEQPLWLSTHSWIQSRKSDGPGEPKFRIETIASAISRGLVKVIKGVKFTRTFDKKEFSGDILLPADYKPGQKQPQYVGVINAKGYVGGRIESKLVRENNGTESRNKLLVARIALPGAPKAAKPEKPAKEAAKPAAKPAAKAPVAPATRKEVKTAMKDVAKK